MRLHTNLRESDILTAGVMAGVVFERLTEHGSRRRPRAFDVVLSGRGRRGSQYRGSDVKSATWDQWGKFLGALYRKDAELIAGEYYVCAEHFDWATGGRFDGREFEHCYHQRWVWVGSSMTNAYAVQHCARCGTVKRFLTGGKWIDLAS